MARYGTWVTGRTAMDHEERSALGKTYSRQGGCDATYPSPTVPFACTRKAGHTGDHIAGGVRAIVARWPRTVGQVEDP